jgi:hypothetical protein
MITDAYSILSYVVSALCPNQCRSSEWNWVKERHYGPLSAPQRLIPVVLRDVQGRNLHLRDHSLLNGVGRRQTGKIGRSRRVKPAKNKTYAMAGVTT